MVGNGEVGNAQTEVPYGKLLNRPINLLYPFEVDEENPLDINDEENTGIQTIKLSGDQKTEKFHSATN
ncbi:hypothetical protein LOAG_07680 [Loa loa]|uniref:Uncharacterized protein n=1 Tax=Loa loa TaxID=7209 RepID=A0A1S0TVJ4_LOALO|nr:hypothetical protein LOAG_07680 [Loa loa]EFO20811.2 hypothetical protein LOAG_07680 [Loa loa]